MYLAGYDFEIYYQKGITNPANTPSKRLDYNKSDGP
jgi:hypothetical protein